ncbi:MAG: hypothetical protein HOV81_11985 [Kofleriaceae bacterium]|nr:hypothetical protein [Kofleriaceae bacterium]
MTTKYWGAQGVKLTVSFMDTTSAALRTRILSHMNAWNRDANVSFVETQQKGQVRIAFTKGDGYWSYVGTDIGLIPSNEPTMNLDSFTMNTPDSEFHRVVRHEAGHTLGFIHEHMRRALVAKIDEEKAISFFMATQGWTKEEVRAQVLTPIEESSLRATTPDPNSIMCYQISGELTVDGEPIPGGVDIDELDHALCAKLYPTPSHEATLTRTTTTQHGGTLLFLPETDPAYIAAVIAAATR